MTQEPSSATDRLIKKYPNRRLYDTKTSAYITLADVKQLVLDNEAFQVVDAKSGEVLYANHADNPRYPASLTKMMTLYLTFEALASGKLRLEDRVVFSPHASAQAPTRTKETA